MNVHSKNYTLCVMEPVIGEEDGIFANIQVTADYKNILMVIEQLKMKLGMSNEYMASFDGRMAKIQRFDLWIEKLASQEQYQERAMITSRFGLSVPRLCMHVKP